MSLHLRRWQQTAAMLPGLVRHHQLVAESNDERLAAQSCKRSITRKQRRIAVERERPPHPHTPTHIFECTVPNWWYCLGNLGGVVVVFYHSHSRVTDTVSMP